MTISSLVPNSTEIQVNVPSVEGADSADEAARIALTLVDGEVVYTEQYKGGAWFVWVVPRPNDNDE